MPDILDQSFEVLGTATITIPRVALSVRVVDSHDQRISVADLTGANRIIFPDALASLSQEQVIGLLQRAAVFLMRDRAGLESL